MNAPNLILSLSKRDIDVQLGSDGRLVIQPASLLTVDDRAAIREHAADIKRRLAANDEPPGLGAHSGHSATKLDIPHCTANDEIRPGIGLLEVVTRMDELHDDEVNPELARNDSNPLPEHQLEVVAMLRADSTLRYAFVTRQEGENIIVTLAVRGLAVCDLTIPASNYDPMTFWKTINEVTQ